MSPSCEPRPGSRWDGRPSRSRRRCRSCICRRCARARGRTRCGSPAHRSARASPDRSAPGCGRRPRRRVSRCRWPPVGRTCRGAARGRRRGWPRRARIRAGRRSDPRARPRSCCLPARRRGRSSARRAPGRSSRDSPPTAAVHARGSACSSPSRPTRVARRLRSWCRGRDRRRVGRLRRVGRSRRRRARAARAFRPRGSPSPAVRSRRRTPPGRGFASGRPQEPRRPRG